MNNNIKKGFKYIVILVFILVLVMGSSFAWLYQQLIGTKTNVLKAGDLSLVLDESETEGISMVNAVPVSDSRGLEQDGYTFKLENNGNVSSNYTIYLDDIALEDDEVRMPDSVVKYSLTKNGVTGESVLLSTIGSYPKRIVDSGTIDGGDTNTYTLKVWMDSDATIDVMESVFYAKLRVEAEQGNVKVEESDMTIDLSTTNQKIDLGEGEDIANYTIDSSDPSIATVDNEGNIVATGYGIVRFTAQNKTTGTKKNITVTITKTLTATYVKQVGVDTIERESDTCILSDKNKTTCQVTLPAITASEGYSVVGWNKDQNATTGDITTTNISEDTNLYTIVKKDEITYKATFVKPDIGVTSIGSEELTCRVDAVYNGAEQDTSCKITLPEVVVEDGYTVIGWSEVEGATSGTVPKTEIDLDSNKKYYLIVKKNAVTLSAKFYLNGAKSLDNSTEEFIIKSCNIEETYDSGEQVTSCIITTPVIEASDATPEIVGFNEEKYAITSTVDSSTELTLNDNNKEYYAITKNSMKTYVATFYKNGSTSLDDDTNDYVTKQCNIAATYNGVEQEAGCNITSPTIAASNVTPTVLGYSLGSDDHNIVWNSNEEKLLTESNNYFAQTSKDAITYNVEYQIGANVSEIGKNSDTCEIATAYNGAEQDTSCSIEAPSITPKEGYTSVGWSKTNGDTIGTTSITLTGNATYYANAAANSYTVEYYKDGIMIGSSGAKVDEDLTLTSIATLNGEKTGYTFKGWATTDGSTTVAYTDGQKVTNLTTEEGTVIKLYGIYVDDILPVCTSTVTTAKINTTDETTVIYTCTDEGSGISGSTLTNSNFTLSDTTNGSIISVSNPTEVVANKEYKYTVTVKGMSVGTFNLSLNEGVIVDTVGNKNQISKSTDITVEGITYKVKFTGVDGVSVTALGSNGLSCTTTGSNTSCDITLPTITAGSGYVVVGWHLDGKLINGTTLTLSKDNVDENNEVTLTAMARISNASEVSFDSSTTGYNCGDIQCAIDELNKEFQ